MRSLHKRTRYYYWLIQTFIKKNARLIALSFIISFFGIVVFINVFPVFNNLFFKKREIYGLVGRYTVNRTPAEITSLVSNPLITINEKGELLPVLAASWEILNSGKIYRFHLKPDLYWNDGKKFTAFDINYQFDGVKINVVDDDTIEFNLNQPLSIFPVYLTKPIIRGVLQGVAGLYELQNYKISKNNFTLIHLSPNSTELSARTYKFYGTEDDLIRAYKKGEINHIETVKKTIADFFVDWKNTEIDRAINYSQILTAFLNTESKLLSSKDVRKALAFAMPRFDLYGEAASGPILPVSWAYKNDLKRYNLDLERAESILEKNISASESAEIQIVTFYDYIGTTEAIKKNLEQIGLKVSIKILSYIPSDFDMFITMWNPPVDPDQYYFWHSTQKSDNITRYKNVKVDKLLEDGRKAKGVAERKAIYQEFQENIVEEVPALFLYHPYVYTIKRK